MNHLTNITYQKEDDIPASELASVFKSSGIKRPADDLTRLQKMIDHADLLITARHQNQLVGIARAITDYSYCCYLSDLAVDIKYQHQGIGTELIRFIQAELSEEVALILLSAPSAMDYYPKMGFEPIDNGFKIARRQ
ncbi:GNAT family N-acetyltransferase [Alkalihalobacillus hemicellulosilyticus]|uniref:Protein export cytoplasm protein SecA ATPase RNA helicase n=1 Tax=Halalkalibacter hemicellulosilyticusJCM 9152 TaxID=1236971 RepID=W4QFS9_9BACI|nr:GNAT family N-acetyltransferase [Halalkalibacter hemicellulosilyticus]GAE30503.1 protein export cytoplasm protein SecA ATPase RNA helicase [Halalkalibacter hemicellulosilyticusJCM 9152]